MGLGVMEETWQIYQKGFVGPKPLEISVTFLS